MTNIIEKPKTNTLIEEYRQQALAYGHEKAIRTFATPMLQAWEKACEGYADEDTELEGFADSCPKYSTSGMRQSPPPSTHDSRSGPSSTSRRKPHAIL